VVPEESLNYFRTIKQYIWDLYWLAADINKGPSLFRVFITQFVPQEGQAPHRQENLWNPINPKPIEAPARIGDPNMQGHMILESIPGPLYAHQRRLSGASPKIVPAASRTIPISAQTRYFDNPPINPTLPSQPSGQSSSLSEATHINGHEIGGQPVNRRQSIVSGSAALTIMRSEEDRAMLRDRARSYVSYLPNFSDDANNVKACRPERS